ncbi:MAG: hypothetical protein GY868_02980 [Deltaproteobacteria bacterium]|nr:hypothetical protein [Deltaproteobacteria bacterium]
MKKILLSAILVLSLILTGTLAFAGGSSPEQPVHRNASGYGSDAGYICNTLYTGDSIEENNAIDFGSSSAGERCWVYIPSVLKNGSSAPVVVYLHGFMAIVPPIYAGQIDHLVRQGYIVIFPEYNLGGFTGMFNDTDQYAQLDRAIAAVDQALALPDVSDRAELDEIVLASHSNGGNLSMGWVAGGGVDVKAMVMQHPCVSNEAIPAFVRDLFLGDMIEVDYAADGPAITCPVIIIGGRDDTIAKVEDFSSLYQALPNAASKVYYQYETDEHGEPILESDHMVPAQSDGAIPGFILDLMSGMGISAFEYSSDDYRIHFAAVDAALDDQTRVTFTRGEWSDGVAVKPVVTLADSEIDAVAVYQHTGFGGYFAELAPGAYTLSDLRLLGIANDDLSSIQVPAGMQATVYQHDNFGGAAQVYTSDADLIVNDDASSIIVE